MTSFKMALSNLIMLIVVFIFNALTGSGMINDLSQADISDMYHTKITPAGFAFSIWGVIYTLVLITVIWMLIKHKDRRVDKIIKSIGWWFNLAALANILWTVSFSYLQLALSTVLIAILLISLVIILKKISRLGFKPNSLLTSTFGIYAGWVTIATVVNIAATLVKREWGAFGLSEVLWANIILAVAIIIVYLITRSTTNVFLPLPVAWAYYAIYVGEGLMIALVGTGLLVAVTLYQFYKNNYSLQQSLRGY